MGKPTGFLEFEREENLALEPSLRVKNYNEFHLPLNMEKRREQGARCMNCGVPFCQSPMVHNGVMAGCPLSNLIPEWNDEIYSSNFEQALARLLKTNNFPEFTSRVCPALCENGCVCGMDSSPVTVRENEYAIIENAYKNGIIKPNPPATRTEKKVAVIGSGPSGLAVADQLNKRGHNVCVFEKADRVGGLLMYGIPNMKLEKNVILRKADIMEKEGVEFITNTEIGKDKSVKELWNEFDAVVLCCGSEKPRDLGYDKSINGVMFAVDFLTASTKALLDSTKNVYSAEGKNVVIIGAGDTSNDCLATAIRQGAKSVYRVDIKDEPKFKKTLWKSIDFPESYASEEARAVYGKTNDDFSTMVSALECKNGVLTGIETVKVEFKNGKLEKIEGSEQKHKADMLITASGFVGCDEELLKKFGMSAERGRAESNKGKVFTAGDMHTGQSLVVKAIAEGRSTAKNVDEFLMGYTNMLK